MAITVQQGKTGSTQGEGLAQGKRAPGPAGILARLTERLFGAEIGRRVQLAVSALDDARDAIISGQSQLERDRFTADREEILRDALLAWRTNPLAKRIVSLTTQYVVGEGITLESKDEKTSAFLKAWWRHRLNRMDVRVNEWCDELTRAGNLIVLISTDAAGMSYVRALPASQVQAIVTAPNDVEQPTAIIEKMQWGATLTASGVAVATSAQGTNGQPIDGTSESGRAPTAWPAYNDTTDAQGPDGAFPTVAIHYAINRPVAAAWGESDLAPLLRWFARYSNWLEDRARLNRYRQAFMYVVSSAFQSKADRLTRQAELNANPPTPGAILVKDDTETWEVLEPRLASADANEDGLALKKMISAGSGNPLHFLAEPESATRTTAEAAGGPTFRHYEQRQNYFLWLLGDVAQVVLNRRALVDSSIDPTAEMTATGSDISARDNASLAQAADFIVSAFANLRDRALIDDAEMLRMIYKFAGENVDVEEMLKRGAAAPPPKLPNPAQETDPSAPQTPRGRPISPDGNN